jgi:hypothetical protein
MIIEYHIFLNIIPKMNEISIIVAYWTLLFVFNISTIPYYYDFFLEAKGISIFLVLFGGVNGLYCFFVVWGLVTF